MKSLPSPIHEAWKWKPTCVFISNYREYPSTPQCQSLSVTCLFDLLENYLGMGWKLEVNGLESQMSRIFTFCLWGSPFQKWQGCLGVLPGLHLKGYLSHHHHHHLFSSSVIFDMPDVCNCVQIIIIYSYTVTNIRQIKLVSISINVIEESLRTMYSDYDEKLRKKKLIKACFSWMLCWN